MVKFYRTLVVEYLLGGRIRREYNAYLVKIRFKGSVSWVKVQARDGGQAKQLVQVQYGGSVDILEAKPK